MYLYLRDGKFLTAKLAKAEIEERTKIPITSAKFCKNYSKFGYGYRIQVQELGKSYRIKPEHISEVISSPQFQNLLKSSHEFKLCQVSFITNERPRGLQMKTYKFHIGNSIISTTTHNHG